MGLYATDFRPSIILNDRDIAPFIYGNAIRIKRTHHDQNNQNDQILQSSDMLLIKNQIPEEFGYKTIFGVDLISLKRDDVDQGVKLLCLDPSRGNIVKSILLITSIEPPLKCTDKDGSEIEMIVLWPQFAAGDKHRCSVRKLLELDQENVPNGTCLYLRHKGPLPISRSSSFFEQMMEYARAMETLMQCWALSHGCDRADSYQHYWSRNFGEIHGESFQHGDVWLSMKNVLQKYSIKGINYVYDSVRSIDLINPLLFQIQLDVLRQLASYPSLCGSILSEGDNLLVRRMNMLLVRQYKNSFPGANGMAERDGLIYVESFDLKKDIIGTFIESVTGSHAKQIGYDVYQQITGRPYEFSRVCEQSNKAVS